MKGGKFDKENKVSSEKKLTDKTFNKNYLTEIIQKIKNNPETQKEMGLIVDKPPNHSQRTESAKTREKGNISGNFL